MKDCHPERRARFAIANLARSRRTPRLFELKRTLKGGSLVAADCLVGTPERAGDGNNKHEVLRLRFCFACCEAKSSLRMTIESMAMEIWLSRD